MKTAPRKLIINRIIRMICLMFALVASSLGVITLVIGFRSFFLLSMSVLMFAAAAGLLEIYLRNFFFVLEEEMKLAEERRGS